MPTKPNENGPYIFASRKDDPDTANDEPNVPISDDLDPETEDLDATGRFRIVEQLDLPKTDCW